MEDKEGGGFSYKKENKVVVCSLVFISETPLEILMIIYKELI